MPILIVDGFQAIHIEKSHAEGALGAARPVELGFHHADQAAIVRETGKRIAYRESAHLIEQASLIQEGAAKHDDVTGGFAEFCKKEWPIQKVARKCCGDVASHIERSDDEKRIIVERTAIFFFMKTAAKRKRGEQEKAGGKQIPGTRNDLQCLRDRSRGRSKKRRA